MGSFEFEGRAVPFEEGDTVASALFRAGVRTFTRSFKYHRRRGLYCLTGDCPNCLISVEGVPAVRSCVTPAREGQKIEREDGWPSADFDLLSVTDFARGLMPVGFYYKTFIHPTFAWRLAEPFIRRATGLGGLPVGRRPEQKPARHLHTGVLVIGAGIAGLAAAKAAAASGESVVLCDEGAVGGTLAAGAALDRLRALEAEVRLHEGVTTLERHAAVGVYDGPFVPLVSDSELVQVHPDRVIVATGAVETHGVFDRNDLPGVFLGRGAARLAGVHGVRPGERAVVAASHPEGLLHLRTLIDAGVEIAAAVLPAELSAEVPAPVAVLHGRVVAAEGRNGVKAVVVETRNGKRRIECDALVLSLGFAPRDALLRMGNDLSVAGAGDVVLPGCSLDEAVESGRVAGEGEAAAESHTDPASLPREGYICLCEDVSVKDLDQALDEGFRSAELLKRYTTATMGPCQGALCGLHLACFTAEKSGSPANGGRTTSRPPARPVRLGDLAGASFEVIEKRTALHGRHLEMVARVDWSGAWKRPYNYGDAEGEYRAVRERVSIMDVSTLGKFLVAGRHAAALVDRVYQCRTDNIEPGRARYALALGEAGYVFDDGLICALDDGRFYLTSTSGGADGMEAWLRDWADRFGMHAHLINRTAELGAILVAGPRSRELLTQLSSDAIDSESFPYMSHREIAVAGVACRAIRVGFVGELAFELHHPRSQSVELWNSLLEAGVDFDIAPHGLDTLEVLRLEKGHLYIGQDSLPDDTPAKLGMEWAVSLEKGPFVGRASLERMAERPLERKLVGIAFEEGTPLRGAPLRAGGEIVGRLTSCERSLALGHAIGLGWIRRVAGEFPSALQVNRSVGRVVPTPFYDPQGARLRA